MSLVNFMSAFSIEKKRSDDGRWFWTNGNSGHRLIFECKFIRIAKVIWEIYGLLSAAINLWQMEVITSPNKQRFC